MIETFELKQEDRIKQVLDNIRTMGIADTKLEQNSNTYAVNENRISLSVEVVMILLIILMVIGMWKLLKHYIRRQVTTNAVVNS